MKKTVAWALSLLNIAVEIVGVLITQIMKNNKRKADARASTGDDSVPLITKADNLDRMRDDLDTNSLPAAK